MAKKNRAMEFYRFISAVLILCYHCHWFAFRKTGEAFVGFYLFVELFFILSGFLMARSIRTRVTAKDSADPAGATVRYLCGRLRQIYPHHLLSWLLVACIQLFLLKNIWPIQIAQIGWAELLLVNIFGFVRGEYINIVCWYLSALLFGSIIVYFLFLRSEDVFVRVIAPVLLVICYGILYDRAGCLAATIVFTRHAPHLGFMRGLADLTVGCLAFRAYEWMQDVRLPGEGFWATLVEGAILAASALYMYGNWGRKLDFLFIPLFFAFVISVFRGRSLFTALFDNRVSEWLGKQSFAFFLNNVVVIYPYMHFFPESNIWAMCWFCVPACLLVSIVTGYGLKYCLNAYKRRA